MSSILGLWYTLPLVAYVTASAISATSSDLNLTLRPGTAYVGSSRVTGRQRMVIYKDWDEECEIIGDEMYISQMVNQSHFYYVNDDFDRIVLTDAAALQGVIAECDRIHLDLFSSNPSQFIDEEEDNLLVDRKDTRRKQSKAKSILSWNLLNRVFIMPGTKWCGQGDIAEHYNDLGYHTNVDKCCR